MGTSLFRLARNSSSTIAGHLKISAPNSILKDTAVTGSPRATALIAFVSACGERRFSTSCVAHGRAVSFRESPYAGFREIYFDNQYHAHSLYTSRAIITSSFAAIR